MTENTSTPDATFTVEQMDTMRVAARMTLNEVTSRADDLRRYLADARDTAARAIEQMQKGNRPGGGFGSGPLGHQLPFDIARANQRLEAALEQAAMYRHLGFFTDDDIAAAYAAGVKGL